MLVLAFLYNRAYCKSGGRYLFCHNNVTIRKAKS